MEVIDHDQMMKKFDSHHHEAQEVYLDGLPAEVLLKIFTFLDIKDLYRCNKVSKRIRSIGLDESLWQKINLNLNLKIPSIFITDILSKGCKYLSLQHAQLEGKLNLKHHSQLKFLDLSCCQSSVPYDGDMKDDVLKRVGISRTFEENALKALATSSKTLEKLSLYYVCLSGKTKIKLIRKLCLQNGRTLKVLNLDSMQLRSDSIHQIATNLPNLTELNLRNTWLSKRAVLSLANHLTAVNIEKLSLEMLKNVDDEIVRKLVSKCHKLNELNLKETSITSFSIKIIIQYLKATIVRLDLSENNIDKAKIVDLEKRLPNLKQVKCDDFGNQGENQEWKKERLQIAKLKIDSEQLKLFTCKKTESENEWSESDEIPDIYSGSE